MGPRKMAKNYLLIGIDEWIVAASPAVLGTTLGSCVSICLWDPQTKTGGLNHFLMPQMATAKNGGQGMRDSQSFYRHQVVEQLIDQILSRGIAPQRLRALVVGGALSKFDYYQIGEKNLNTAVDILKEKGIEQIKLSGGGTYSRRVTFYLEDGRVTVSMQDLSRKTRDTQEIIQL